MMPNIVVNPRGSLKPKPDWDALEFGSHTTDHLFVVEYKNATGWTNARVQPYGNLSLDPTALVLHYAQAIFEGVKIYRQMDGTLAAFRPDQNAARLNRSAEKMAMPALPPELFLQGLKRLATIDADWMPDITGFALYVRPVMIATQPTLGVQSSTDYLFYMLLTPVKPYFSIGQPGLRLVVKNDRSRSSLGDVSDAKTAGNYGKTICTLGRVKEEGYDNLLWLGGDKDQMIEEAGITNVFVRFTDHIATPPLNGRILPGVTRDTVIQLLRQQGHTLLEREIDIRELCDGIASGEVKEVFVTGTATAVAPVAAVTYGAEVYEIRQENDGLATDLYSIITKIQSGQSSDTNGWMYSINKDVH